MNVIRLGPPRRGISDATRNGEVSAEQTKTIWEGWLEIVTSLFCPELEFDKPSRFLPGA